MRASILACVAAAAASRSHEFRPAHPRGSMVVITGTGRTGTTFLMTLLTYLGLPTGLDFGEWSRNRTSPPVSGVFFIVPSPAPVTAPPKG